MLHLQFLRSSFIDNVLPVHVLEDLIKAGLATFYSKCVGGGGYII